MSQELEKKGRAEIAFNVGQVSITVEVDHGSTALLGKMLAECLNAVNENEKALKEMTTHFLASSSIPVPRQTQETPSSSTAQKTSTSLSPIIEIYAPDKVKFIAQKSYELSIADAIALLMYALDRPLRPLEISNILSDAWKKVPINAVTSRFSTSLKPMTIKKDESGYVLTGTGRKHVEDNVLPFCNASEPK